MILIKRIIVVACFSVTVCSAIFAQTIAAFLGAGGGGMYTAGGRGA